MTEDERLIAIRKLANKKRGVEGDIEFDVDAEVSEGDDNGAYVKAWVWINFSGTELDKEKGKE